MNKNFTNKDTENNASIETAKESDATKSLPQRRVQDGITLKRSIRNMNLDRRHENSERRGDGDPNYKGPSRRYTIDRRLTTRDRRQAAWINEIFDK